MKKKVLVITMIMACMSMTACGAQKNDNLEATEATEVVAEVEGTESVELAEENLAEGTEESTEEASETETEGAEEIIGTTEAEATIEVCGATVEPEKEQYTYSDMDGTKYATTNANVRDLPDIVGAKITSLAYNKEVTVTGVCNETGWFRIDVDGKTGYVSDKYLSDTKGEEKVAEKTDVQPTNVEAPKKEIASEPAQPYGKEVRRITVYLEDSDGHFTIPKEIIIYEADEIRHDDYPSIQIILKSLGHNYVEVFTQQSCNDIGPHEHMTFGASE